MEQKTLAKWLKVILIGVTICGLIVFFVIVPAIGKSTVEEWPEFANRYWPWLIFSWLFAIPCFIIVYFCWKIVDNIGKDQSFCLQNADYFKWISLLAGSDSRFLFIGNIVLMFMNMNHAGIILRSLVIVFIGIAVTIAAATLSHLVKKAADLQQESDLTI